MVGSLRDVGGLVIRPCRHRLGLPEGGYGYAALWRRVAAFSKFMDADSVATGARKSPSSIISL